MGQFRNKAREARLRWFRHVISREDHVRRMILSMEPPRRRKIGKPKRFMDTLREYE